MEKCKYQRKKPWISVADKKTSPLRFHCTAMEDFCKLCYLGCGALRCCFSASAGTAYNVAVQIVDDVLLQDVIGRADVKMRDQVLLHQLPCGAVRNADHFTKLVERHYIWVLTEAWLRHDKSTLTLKGL